MKTIKQLRHQLNLSQADLARYLGVSRFKLMRVEQGSSTLGSEALIKVAKLEGYILRAREGKESIIVPGDDQTEQIKAYELREQTCLFEANLLQRKLNSLEYLYESNHEVYKILALMKIDGTEDPLWVKETRIKAEIKLATCTSGIRTDLGKKIEVLRAEAQYIRQYLEGFTA